MDGVNTEWLPHLHPEVISETEGNYLDAYVIALEGWRRGLTLKWHVKDSEKFKTMKTWYVEQPGQLFSLHSKDRSHYFFRSRGDKVPNEAVEQGMDKAITKEILHQKGIPVPKGKEFTKEATNEMILTYAKELGYPLVAKPTDGSFGRGVIANIGSVGELTYSLDYLRTELEEENIIVEGYLQGKDYRLYVVGEQVVGAILRVPPQVVGDGMNSIESLIEIKNAERNLNPRLVSCPLQMNKETIDYMGRFGHTLEQVPEAGKVIYLGNKGNVSLGGDPIDVLDDLSDEIKNIAVQAIHAIPGLGHGAVYMIIEKDEQGNETGHVIELNPTAQLGGLLFPMQGKPRDIPKAIIDYYFPETKDVEVESKRVYFDFYDVLEPLISRQAMVSTVTPAPVGKVYMTQYTVYGDVQDPGYHQGLRKQAFERGLHGHVMNIENEAIEIVVAGTDPQMVEEFQEGITEDEERANVLEIEQTDYEGFVKVGFDSRANYKTIEEELNVLKEDIEKTQFDIRELEVRKRKLQGSMSWRITYPVRVVGAVKKVFKR